MHDAPETPEQPEHESPANGPADEHAPGPAGVEVLSYAAAAARLGLSPDAVRMQCRRGRLVCVDGDRGRLVVWPQPDRDAGAAVRQPVSEQNGERTDRPKTANRSAEQAAANARRAEHERDAARVEAAQLRTDLDAANAQLAVAWRAVDRLSGTVEAYRQENAALAADNAALRALPPAVPFASRTADESTANANGSPGRPPAASMPAPRPWWKRLLPFLP